MDRDLATKPFSPQRRMASAPSNVIPFPEPLPECIVPFDPTDPSHVNVWNMLWKIGCNETERRDREEGRE